MHLSKFDALGHSVGGQGGYSWEAHFGKQSVAQGVPTASFGLCVGELSLPLVASRLLLSAKSSARAGR